MYLGSTVNKISAAEMVFLFTALLYGYLASNMYASELVSINLSSNDNFKLNSIKDLLDSTIYTPMLANGTSWISMLEVS